jgi:hypothetical protein
LITQASGAIADYCKRVFAEEIVEQTFRLDRLHRELILARYPVSGVDSVVEGDVTLDAEDYEVNAANGVLVRLHGGRECFWPCAKITVRYTGGYQLLDGMPFAVERAAIVLIKQWNSASGRDPLTKEIEIPGVERTSFWIGGIGDNGALPPEVLGLLGPHRNRILR